MLSIMNEIDPCLLLLLCVLYEIQNQIFQHHDPFRMILNFCPISCLLGVHWDVQKEKMIFFFAKLHIV